MVGSSNPSRDHILLRSCWGRRAWLETFVCILVVFLGRFCFSEGSLGFSTFVVSFCSQRFRHRCCAPFFFPLAIPRLLHPTTSYPSTPAFWGWVSFFFGGLSFWFFSLSVWGWEVGKEKRNSECVNLAQVEALRGFCSVLLCSGKLIRFSSSLFFPFLLWSCFLLRV